MTQPHYQQPGWFTKHVFNGLVAIVVALHTGEPVIDIDAQAPKHPVFSVALSE